MDFRFVTTPDSKAKIKGPFRIFRLYKKSYKGRSGSKTLSSKWVLEVNLRRLFGFSALGAVCCYLLATVVLFLWRDRKPHNLVTYWDIALPHRWNGITEKLGQSKIKQGMASFENGEYMAAFGQLRSGLARYPADSEARLVLGRLYLAAKRPTLAMTILEKGFEFGTPDREYVAVFFNWAMRYSQFELAERISRELLESGDSVWSGESEIELALVRFRVLQAMEKAEDMLSLCQAINAKYPEKPPLHDGEIFALIQLGRLDEALRRIEDYKKLGYTGDELNVLRLKAVIASGDSEEIEKTYAELKKGSPDLASIRTEYIMHHVLAENTVGVQGELEEYRWMFAGDVESIDTLCSRLANAGCTQPLQYFMRLVDTEPNKYHFMHTLLIQSLLVEEKWEEALQVNRRWLEGLDEEAEVRVMGKWVELLVESAHHGEPTAAQALLEFLQEVKLPVPVYEQTAKVYAKLDEWNQVFEVANLGLSTHPFHQGLVALRSEAELKAEDKGSFREQQIGDVLAHKNRYRNLVQN